MCQLTFVGSNDLIQTQQQQNEQSKQKKKGWGGAAAGTEIL
jgi:hypothetical protein